MSQNIDCLRQVFAGQAHTLTFPGLLLEPNMISRPANNRYWGQSLHSVSITKSLVFMRGELENICIWDLSLVIAHQDVPSGPWLGKKTRVCWLDSEFSCHHSSLLWATCFLLLLGDFGDWIKIYIFSQNFWKMIRVKSYSLFLTTKEMSYQLCSLTKISDTQWWKVSKLFFALLWLIQSAK